MSFSNIHVPEATGISLQEIFRKICGTPTSDLPQSKISKSRLCTHYFLIYFISLNAAQRFNTYIIFWLPRSSRPHNLGDSSGRGGRSLTRSDCSATLLAEICDISFFNYNFPLVPRNSVHLVTVARYVFQNNKFWGNSAIPFVINLIADE